MPVFLHPTAYREDLGTIDRDHAPVADDLRTDEPQFRENSLQTATGLSSSRCIPPGPRSSACSAGVQSFLRSSPATRPNRYSRTRTRGSERANRPAISVCARYSTSIRTLITTGHKGHQQPGERRCSVGPCFRTRVGRGLSVGTARIVGMVQTLGRREASDAVFEQGWRFLLGSLRTSVRVGSVAQAVEVASNAAVVCGGDADRHLRVDIRSERVVLTLQSLDLAAVTARDVDLARGISAALNDVGLSTEPEIGADAARSVQLLEIAIDVLEIAAVRPFWKAVMGYGGEPGADGPEDALVDPVGQGPAIWFQQMDRPRPQRNRIHFDICVPHDEAPRRIEAALASGADWSPVPAPPRGGCSPTSRATRCA